MFHIHQKICCEYPQNFRGLATHGFAHARFKMVVFNPEIIMDVARKSENSQNSTYRLSMIFQWFLIENEFMWDMSFNYRVRGLQRTLS